MRGAIAKTADSVYQKRLSEAQKPIARMIFLRLTELGEGTQDTRRRVHIDELMTLPVEDQQIVEVTQILVQARLITTGEETVEVAHEAVIREWDRLRHWLAEDRENIRLHRQITRAAERWRNEGEVVGALYRGVFLARALAFLEHEDKRLNALEKRFIEESQHAAEAEAREREEARQRELAQARYAQSQYLANSAREVASKDPMLALLLAIEADEASDNPLAFDVLHERASVISVPQVKIELEQESDKTVFDPSDRYFAALFDENESYHQLEKEYASYVDIRSAETGQKVQRLEHDAAIVDVLWVNGEGLLLTALASGERGLWNAAEGKLLRQFRATSVPLAAMRSGDGRYLISVGPHESVVWNIEEGSERPLELPEGHHPTQIQIAPNGKWLLTAADAAANLAVWELESARLLWNFDRERESLPGQALWSPDGASLGHSFDGIVRVWDSTSGALRFELTPFEGHLCSVQWRGDGEVLFAADYTGKFGAWTAADGALLYRFQHELKFESEAEIVEAENVDEVDEVKESRFSSFMYEPHPDGRVTVWDGKKEEGERQQFVLEHPNIYDLTLSDERGFLITFSEDGLIKRWSAEDGTLAFAVETGWPLDEIFIDEDALITYFEEQKTLKLLAETGEVLGRFFCGDGFDCLLTPQGVLQVQAGYSDLDEPSEVAVSDVENILFDKTARLIFTLEDQDQIKVWQVGQGKMDLLFELTHAGVTQARRSEQRPILFTQSEGELRAWSAETGEALYQIKIDTGLTSWTENESDQILTFDAQRVATLWSAEDGVFEEDLWQVEGVSRYLQIGEAGVTVIDFESGKTQQIEQKGVTAVFANAQNIFTVVGKKHVKMWSAEAGELVIEFEHPKVVHVHQVGNSEDEYDPNKNRIVSLGSDGTLKIFDFEDDEWQSVSVKLPDATAVRAIAFEETIYTSYKDGSVKTWQLAESELVSMPLLESESGRWLYSYRFDANGDCEGILVVDRKSLKSHWLDHEFAVGLREGKSADWLYTIDNDGRLQVWGLNESEEMEQWGMVAINWVQSVYGRLLYTWDTLGRVQVWQASTGNLVCKIEHGEDLAELREVADGRLLLTIDDDHVVKAWYTDNGEKRHEIATTGLSPDSLSWSPDNSMVLMHRESNALVESWDTEVGQIRFLASSQERPRWHPTRIIGVQELSSIKLLSINGGEVYHVLEHEQPITHWHWSNWESSSNSLKIFSETAEQYFVWELGVRSLLPSLDLDLPVSKMALNKAKTHLFVEIVDPHEAYTELHVWDVVQGQLIFSPETYGTLKSMWHAEAGKLLLLDYSAESAAVWDDATGKITVVYEDQQGIHEVTWHPDGEHLLVERFQNESPSLNEFDMEDESQWMVLELWHIGRGEPVAELAYPYHSSLNKYWSPSGRLLLLESRNQRAVLNFDSGTVLDLEVERLNIGWLTWLSDAELLSDTWSTIRVLDSKTGKFKQGQIEPETDNEPHEIFLNKDRKTVWLKQESLTLWEIQTQQQTHHITAVPEGEIVGRSQDESKFLLTDGSKVHLLDVSDADQSITLVLNNEEVDKLMLSPDETCLLIKTRSDVVQVWDTTSGRRLFTINPHGSITEIIWSPDGSQIYIGTVFGTDEGRVLRYYARTTERLTAARQRATRNLSWVEWQAYFPNLPYRKTCPELPVGEGVPEDKRV